MACINATTGEIIENPPIKENEYFIEGKNAFWSGVFNCPYDKKENRFAYGKW